MEVRMHRFVLAEFNTHRVFSRNSASSRAIPVRRTLGRVAEDPAIPLGWPTEQKGMQGGEPLGEQEADQALEIWLKARDQAIESASQLATLGVHKSVTNRLLEPFMWHTVIVSSTEWENFWGLRLSALAQPEMGAVASLMREAYLGSNPTPLAYGQWHLPYIRTEDQDLPVEQQCKISAARCARVSYLTHDGVRDPDKDIELYDRLVTVTPPHASPLEHVATPCSGLGDHLHRGNFEGWDQLRHSV